MANTTTLIWRRRFAFDTHSGLPGKSWEDVFRLTANDNHIFRVRLVFSQQEESVLFVPRMRTLSDAAFFLIFTPMAIAVIGMLGWIAYVASF